MEDVRRFAKDKLDLTQEDVINYVNKHRPRFVLAAIVCVLQFLVVFFLMRGTGWRERYAFTKLWIILWLILLMTILELLRYSDFIFKKYGLDKYLGGSGGSASSSSASSGSSHKSAPPPVKSEDNWEVAKSFGFKDSQVVCDDLHQFYWNQIQIKIHRKNK